MLKFSQLTLQRGSQLLLENVDLTIHAQQKVGLIGANGSGKSSLLQLIIGELEADAGSLELPKHLRIAYVQQEITALDRPAIEYVLDGDKELRGLQQQLAIATDANAIAQLHGRLETIAAYSSNARAAQILAGLSFKVSDYNRPVAEFSGGWRMRLNLAQALLAPSDLLLLDEPTNHLDLDAILWLETWLQQYAGTVLIISHDQSFLDGVVSHIAHLEHRQLKLYTGNYSAFAQQYAAQLVLQHANFIKQQKQREHLQSFIDRFRYKASKAKQAQSRMKALERMSIISAVQINNPFQFQFRSSAPAPNPLLSLEQVVAGYQEQTPILQQFTLNIAPAARIGLLGPNGAGKSTLMKILAGTLPPLQGQRLLHRDARIAYFTQYQLERLEPEKSPLQHLQALDSNAPVSKLRSFLGEFGFSGDMALAPIANFSGGEQARLALALLIWQQPNLLLLDEPTNHLDLSMRQALAMALQSYNGALVLVSHDRQLLSSTTDEFILVANGKVEKFAGDLGDYQLWLKQFRREQDIQAVDVQQQTNVKLNNTQSYKLQKNLMNRYKSLEKQLQSLQTEYTQLELSLADPALYHSENKTILNSYLAQQTKLKQQLSATEEEWLQVLEQLEANN